MKFQDNDFKTRGSTKFLASFPRLKGRTKCLEKLSIGYIKQNMYRFIESKLVKMTEKGMK